MSATTLAASAIGALLSSLLYIFVGHVLRKRQVSPDAKLAQGMFVLWWQSLGYLGLLGVGVTAVYAAGALEVWLYQAYTMLVLLVLFVALWGLQFYLVYLYTGSRRWFAPLGAFYAVLFMATVALIEYIGAPQSIGDDGWTLRAEPEPEFPLAYTLGFLVLIVGPQIAAAISYASLYRKVTDRTQKYRIGLVTGSIIVWFGSSLVVTAAGGGESLAWQLASRALGVLAALVILWAYKPPRWVQQRYGVRSITDDAPVAGPAG